MVDVVVLAVLKSTAGWLDKKGRHRAMKNLKQSGDVVNQALCSVIANDLDLIKSEIKAAKSADLLTNISLFKEGLRSISFDAEWSIGESSNGPPQKKMRMDNGAPLARRDVKMSYEGKVNLNPKTKERFREAPLKAGEALSNEKLEIMDRILAYYVKVMATLLEDADDDPSRAILFCKDSSVEMNSMKAVSKTFASEISTLSSPYEKAAAYANKERRTDIIWSVCHVNRVVFEIAQLVGGERVFQELFIWPCIEIRKGNEREVVDLFGDQRLLKSLQSVSKEDCCVIQSFGHEGHKLTLPCGIAANPPAQFLVVDDTKTDLFDNEGKYLHSLHFPTDNTFQYRAVDIDTGRDGNAYLLAAKQDHERTGNKCCDEVFVFDIKGKLHHKFPLKNESKGHKLALVNQHGDNTEVLVLEGEKGLNATVEIYDTDGIFLREFGKRILQDVQDIVGTNDGRIYVLDKCRCKSGKKFILEFDDNRCKFRRFDMADDSILAIAFHGASESIVTISASDHLKSFVLSVYYKASEDNGNNKDGDLKLLRTYKYDIDPESVLLGLHVTVTAKGRIAVVMAKNTDRGEPHGKVIVY